MDIYEILKAILIISCSYAFFLKVSGWNITVIKKIIIGFIFTPVFSAIIWIMAIYIEEPYKSALIIFFASVFLNAVRKDKFKDVVADMIIALALSHILYILTTAIAAIVQLLIFNSKNYGYKMALITGIIELIAAVFISKIKIDISQMQKRIGGIGIILAEMALITYSLFRQQGETYSLFRQDGKLSFKTFWLVFSLVVLCAVGIMYWFKKESVIAFNSKVKEIENARLKNSLNKAQEENDFLDDVLRYTESRLHNENKRLPAYQEAVEELINGTTDEKIKPRAIKVLNELLATRTELPKEQSKELRKDKKLPTTGMMLLDAVIAHLSDMAAQKDIVFNMIVCDDLNGITDVITQTQLETLAANLIQNAITAVEHGKNLYRCINFYFICADGEYSLIIEDSGTLFEIDTLLSLGTHRVTTHAETGGSGIGYMTIFEIVNGCKASYIMRERAEKSGFVSKSIVVRFDGKNDKIICSHRAEQIREKCTNNHWIIEYLYEQGEKSYE